MAKQGMKRPEVLPAPEQDPASRVPEIQGRAKQGKQSARPLVAGTDKVWHTDRPISSAYSTIDTDLARDNLENDLTAADRQDL